jgi:hypothetical protein
VQVPDPESDLYVLETQGIHVPPSNPEYPGLHLQAVTEVLIRDELEYDGHLMQSTEPSELYVPAPQFVQTMDPVESLYFPATHTMHVPVRSSPP